MKLNVVFVDCEKTLDVSFQSNDLSFSSEFGEVYTITEYVGGTLYDGEYNIVPKVESQIMQTAGKVMSSNITIQKIPFFETSNLSGGSTIFIADIIEEG